MLKVKVVSDLHLEFGDLDLKNKENADVLVLSGDICLLKVLHYKTLNVTDNPFTKFFDRVCEAFPEVVYVPGNHEFYNYDLETGKQTFDSLQTRWGNLHPLNNSAVQIGDVTFVGGTLWTDFDNDNPVAMSLGKLYMNDFRIINVNAEVNVPFHPQNALKEHKQTLEAIRLVCKEKEGQKVAVITHHTPSYQSCVGVFKGDPLNPCYATNLEQFIQDRPNIQLWTHGHVHSSHDYMIGTTRIVCNPRGYCIKHRENKEFNPNHCITI